jgi:hypothetical protein
MSAITVNVPETPHQSPLLDKGTISPPWREWFASLGTWIKESASPEQLSLSIGNCQVARVGAVVSINCQIPPGTYVNTSVTGMLKPLQNVAVLAQGSAGLGICELDEDGNLILNITSTTTILLAATFIAGKE